MARYSENGLEKIRIANERRFIEDAKKKHNDKFDYSHVEYKRQKSPVKIGCPIHGFFYQTPDKHLQSIHGCQQCSLAATAKKRKRAGCERFLAKFSKKFRGRIELLSSYLGADQRIQCRCLKHDIIFECTPNSFNLYSHVCPKCANESYVRSRCLKADEFYERIKKKFDDNLDFTNTIYSGPKEKVSVICREHGEFYALPKSLLKSSHGCPACSSIRKGYASWRLQNIENMPEESRTSHIGLMKVKVFGITSYKLGTSKRKLQSRYKEALHEIFFDAVLDEIDTLRLEIMLHSKYLDFRDERIFKAGMRAGKRWSGDSELYVKKVVPLILKDLKKYVKDLEHKKPDYWDDKPLVMPPILRIQKVRRGKGIWNKPRPVVCLNDMKVYPSASEVAKQIGTSQGNVSAACVGLRGQANGLKFVYLDEYEKGNLPNFTNKQKGADNPKARAIICVDTGEIFPTSIAAGEAKKTSPSHITSVCKGRRKIAGGFKWAYKDSSVTTIK